MSNEIAREEERPNVWSDFDRAFDELSAGCFGAYVPSLRTDSGWLRPARTDVADDGKSYRVTAEIPGIPKEKLDIRVRGTTVEIRGENGRENEGREGSYLHRERAFEGYYRFLELPEPVIAAEAKAKVDNGVLELELPKQHPTPEPDEVKVPVV